MLKWDVSAGLYVIFVRRMNDANSFFFFFSLICHHQNSFSGWYSLVGVSALGLFVLWHGWTAGTVLDLWNPVSIIHKCSLLLIRWRKNVEGKLANQVHLENGAVKEVPWLHMVYENELYWCWWWFTSLKGIIQNSQWKVFYYCPQHGCCSSWKNLQYTWECYRFFVRLEIL